MHSSLEAKVVILGSQGKDSDDCGNWIKHHRGGLIHIVVLGVGKTSVVVRCIDRVFTPNSTSTIGASFMSKKL